MAPGKSSGTIHRIRVPIPPAQPWKMSVKCPGRFKRQPGTRKDTSKPTNHREECGASRRLPIRERASRSRPSLLHFNFPVRHAGFIHGEQPNNKMNIIDEFDLEVAVSDLFREAMGRQPISPLEPCLWAVHEQLLSQEEYRLLFYANF